MHKSPTFFSGWTPLWLTLVLVTGCAPAATPVPTSTNPPVSTLIPVSTPTTFPTKTPALIPTPTNQANCTDSALFLADVTIPDGAKLKQGKAFTKTWQLKNTGTCTWNNTYSLAFLSGERMDAPAAVPLAETLPGKTLDLSIPLTAPARDGVFAALFELRSPSGRVIPIGLMTSIWVKISIGVVVSAQPAVSTPFIPQGGGAASCNSRQNDGYSLDMSCNNFLDHRGSDGSWIGDRLTAAGYATYNYTEIIAIGSPQDAMTQWRNSPTHWIAVLDASLTEFGIGYVYVKDSNFGGYFTVDLASP
jgi:hypothetical protein